MRHGDTGGGQRRATWPRCRSACVDSVEAALLLGLEHGGSPDTHHTPLLTRQSARDLFAFESPGCPAFRSPWATKTREGGLRGPQSSDSEEPRLRGLSRRWSLSRRSVEEEEPVEEVCRGEPVEEKSVEEVEPEAES
jgi:hypothetical protein